MYISGCGDKEKYNLQTVINIQNEVIKGSGRKMKSKRDRYNGNI